MNLLKIKNNLIILSVLCALSGPAYAMMQDQPGDADAAEQEAVVNPLPQFWANMREKGFED